MLQKLNYIHQNPVKAGLVANDIDDKYSSALQYSSHIVIWDFITKWEVYKKLSCW